MRESAVEKYLDLRVKAEGGLSRKWVSPGRRGVNDRIVIFPGGRVSFVEVKRPPEPGKKRIEPSGAQKREHARLRAQGCCVVVVDTKEGVDEFIKWRTA